MTNSVQGIHSFEKKKRSYKNEVSIYVFKYPGKQMTEFLASNENFYRQNFLPSNFFMDKVFYQ